MHTLSQMMLEYCSDVTLPRWPLFCQLRTTFRNTFEGELRRRGGGEIMSTNHKIAS